MSSFNLMIDPHHICNVIYNAWSNRHHPPTAPSTAPATQNESHDWSASHMQRHLQCAEQKASPSNLTKYCACHAKWISWLIALTYETSFTMRGATGISLRPHQILRLPRKMNLMIAPRHIWNVIYNAWSNRHHPPTAPNTVPATQNECHDWSCSPMKRHFQCAEQQESPSHFTKYCACHAKWISCLIRITYETSFPMRGATGINLQPHQILRLPRKIALPNLREINWKQLKWHFQCATDPTMIREWSENDPTQKTQTATRRALHQMLRLPQKMTHELHQMLHLPRKVTHELHQMLRLPRKVTHELHQCCTCHTKWNMNVTKCCTCHKKWHMNFYYYYYYYDYYNYYCY